LRGFLHAGERPLGEAGGAGRVARPLEWGLDWIPSNGHAATRSPRDAVASWVAEVMADTDAFFTPPPCDAYERRVTNGGEALLTFPSALDTPHGENNTVYCRYFPARRRARSRRAAVVVLPQWN